MILIRTLIAVVAVVAAMPATAETLTRGTVVAVDMAARKVTVDHEELVDLGMPAMTMVFRVADPAMLDALSEGKEIRFVAERVEGKLTIARLQ